MDLANDLWGASEYNLSQQFGDVRSLYIAVNKEYAKDDLVLKETDEIALIPPVSGG